MKYYNSNMLNIHEVTSPSYMLNIHGLIYLLQICNIEKVLTKDLRIAFNLGCRDRDVSSVETQREKTYLQTGAPRKDSDQLANLRSLITLHGAYLDSIGCKFSSCGHSDQTARKHRLIRVFVERADEKVIFLTLIN